MTPALTLTLSAQAMTAASAVIGQQMRLVDVVIDHAVSAQRALLAPVYAFDVKPKAPVATKKTAAPKVKAKVKAKTNAKTKSIAPKPKPKPKLVAKAKLVVATPAKTAPVAKAKPAKVDALKAPVAVTQKAAPAPVAKSAGKAAAKAVAAPEPKLAAKAKPPARDKKVSVPDTPWDSKDSPTQVN